jgi:hypothetical protein
VPLRQRQERKLQMKLDLEMMADFAKQEMRDRVKLPKDSADSHLAKCWVAAFIRSVSKEQGSVLIKTKDEIQTLENV